MEKFNIEQLLKYNMVVPEIQRDYVWGEKVTTLGQFLDSLLTKDSGDNIGFLYSYEREKDNYIIDGQQRFTTIILLLYYLSQDNLKRFQECIRLHTSNIAFNYRVRRTTDVFLYHLFCHTLSRSNIAEDIKDQLWYVDDFNYDRSVKSVLSCLSFFSSYFNENPDAVERLTYDAIYRNITFWYFKVNETSQGEELYISMNSRGESLKGNEHIKSLLLKKQPYMAKEWDNWEEFFYTKIPQEKDGTRNISSIDNAMDNLILVSLEMHTQKTHVKIEHHKDKEKINLTDIKEYFDCLKECWDVEEYNKCFSKLYLQSSQFTANDKLLIEAVISARRRTEDKQEIRRTFELVSNLIRRGKGDKREYILILLSDNQNCIYQTVKNDKDNFKTEFGEHEYRKINILSNAKDKKQEQLESLIWEAQSIPVTKGNIKCIWLSKFSSSSDDDVIMHDEWNFDTDTKLFEERLMLFKVIFANENIKLKLSRKHEDYRIDNSIITRTLIAVAGKVERSESCCVHKSAANFDFGYGDSWATILNKKKGYRYASEMISRIHRMDSKGNNVYGNMNDIIKDSISIFKDDNCVDTRYYILKYSDSLQSMNDGYNMLNFNGGWGNYGIYVLNGKDCRASYINLFVNLIYNHIDKEKYHLGNNLKLLNGLRLTHCDTHDLYIDFKETTLDQNVVLSILKERGYSADRDGGNIKIYLQPCDDLIMVGCKIIEIIYNIHQ